MSNTPQNVPGGNNQNPGGNPDPKNPDNTDPKNNPNPGAGDPPPDDKDKTKDNKVDYASYQKVLDEKKALKRELEAEKEAKRQREEEEARKSGDLKKLNELKDSELKEIKEKYHNLSTTIEKSVKRQAFLSAVNGKVDEALYPLIDLDKIVIDPDTGIPDDLSVQRAAKDFETRFGNFLVKDDPNRQRMPNNAPQPPGKGLTYEEWLKLPSKEMRARIHEVNKSKQ